MQEEEIFHESSLEFDNRFSAFERKPIMVLYTMIANIVLSHLHGLDIRIIHFQKDNGFSFLVFVPAAPLIFLPGEDQKGAITILLGQFHRFSSILLKFL